MGPARWFIRFPLGVVVLLPAAGAVGWFGLTRWLLPEPIWMILLGIPFGWALLTFSTVLILRGPPERGMRLVFAAIVAPLRAPPPARRWVRSLATATGEELFFRLLGLWLIGPELFGIVLTTAFFALAHLVVAKPGRVMSTLLDATICGAALAVVYVETGGLGVVVVAHFVRNLSLDALRLRVTAARARAEAKKAIFEANRRGP